MHTVRWTPYVASGVYSWIRNILDRSEGRKLMEGGIFLLWELADREEREEFEGTRRLVNIQCGRHV
jgi:hypothetical protein